MSTPIKKIPLSHIEDIPTGEPFISITKAELDTHIANSTLKPGVLYEIKGVDVPLYGGTDIYLRAVSNNALESYQYSIDVIKVQGGVTKLRYVDATGQTVITDITT